MNAGIKMKRETVKLLLLLALGSFVVPGCQTGGGGREPGAAGIIRNPMTTVPPATHAKPPRQGIRPGPPWISRSGGRAAELLRYDVKVTDLRVHRGRALCTVSARTSKNQCGVRQLRK